jgi:hypothetical protein
MDGGRKQLKLSTKLKLKLKQLKQHLKPTQQYNNNTPSAPAFVEPYLGSQPKR